MRVGLCHVEGWVGVIALSSALIPGTLVSCLRVTPVSSLTPAEHLLKPQLSLNVVGQKLMKGQTMELACEAAYGFSGARFFLYKDGRPSPVTSRLAPSRSPRAHFTFNDVSSANSGNYSCCYQVWIAGQRFNSSLSDPVNITVN
ncbi:hypothetical protein chiPu_0028308, partial [Chiloscyllium punctatum]|nr:hypothetical protein [Chiloscyllium punctatum]